MMTRSKISETSTTSAERLNQGIASRQRHEQVQTSVRSIQRSRQSYSARKSGFFLLIARLSSVEAAPDFVCASGFFADRLACGPAADVFQDGLSAATWIHQGAGEAPSDAHSARAIESTTRNARISPGLAARLVGRFLALEAHRKR